MGQIFTQLLWVGVLPVRTSVLVYTATNQTVLRDLELANDVAAITHASLQITVPGTGQASALLFAMPASVSTQWEGRIALPPGGTVHIYADGQVEGCLTGYVFTS